MLAGSVDIIVAHKAECEVKARGHDAIMALLAEDIADGRHEAGKRE